VGIVPGYHFADDADVLPSKGYHVDNILMVMYMAVCHGVLPDLNFHE
jgi:hypothetical protein